MARRLFGTDGIRGVAGEYPLDGATAHAVGVALGEWIRRRGEEPRVVVGMDTRESGPGIAANVAGGLGARGVEVRLAGVTTTPGVAYLAKTGPYSAGVMISASHNPYQDNGIKLIGHSGYKFPDADEEVLEGDIFRQLEAGAAADPVEVKVDGELDRLYLKHLAETMSGPLGGIRMVADCANGSASLLGPELLKTLGASVDVIGASPDGRNINLNCGSLHLEGLRGRVVEIGAALGVAFDGDADRALFVTGEGKVVDGDAVLLVCARQLQEQGRLPGKAVVATVMSNLGLELALADLGIELVRTPVGDKYVLEEMLKRDAPIGGEQSGHIIFRDYATTGDGLLTALRVLDVVQQTGKSLAELTSALSVYPQTLVNVRIRVRKPLDELPRVQARVQAVEEEFGREGRVLVRFSGTEPLARVMVEGPDLKRVKKYADEIAAEIRGEIGLE